MPRRPEAVDPPTTAEGIVDHARLTAQAEGKVLLAEMIEAMDEMISLRCASMRVLVRTFPDAYTESFDWRTWGRTTHVYEAVLSFLQRIDSDPAARDHLAKIMRGEVIRSVDVRND